MRSLNLTSITATQIMLSEGVSGCDFIFIGSRIAEGTQKEPNILTIPFLESSLTLF